MDITERKSNEEKLGESNHNIHTNVKLRVVGGLTRHDVRKKLSCSNWLCVHSEEEAQGFGGCYRRA